MTFGDAFRRCARRRVMFGWGRVREQVQSPIKKCDAPIHRYLSLNHLYICKAQHARLLFHLPAIYFRRGFITGRSRSGEQNGRTIFMSFSRTREPLKYPSPDRRLSNRVKSRTSRKS